MHFTAHCTMLCEGGRGDCRGRQFDLTLVLHRRSWIFLCERMYMEDYEMNRITRSSFVSTMTGASQFGPSMKSMLGDYEAKVQQEEGPRTIKIGNESVEMPQKKSKKKVRSRVPKMHLQM